MDILKQLFEQHFHAPPTRVQPLQGHLSGSGRNIIRLGNDQSTAIGILYGVREENVAFLEFSKCFRRHGLPVPEIYGEDLEAGAYLEQDLGDITLYDYLSQNRSGDEISPEVVETYRKVVEVLPRFQVEVRHEINYKVCYPRTSFDRQSIAWDLNYFKYYFLRLAGIPFNEQALENDFATADEIPAERRPRLLSLPRFPIAQRDAGRGQPVSLWTTRAGARARCNMTSLPCCLTPRPTCRPSYASELLDHYLAHAAGFIPFDRGAFLHHYYAYVYVRVMQALGAYGFRGFYERKPLFLQSVPYALKNIRWLLHNVTLPIALPSLTEAFTSMLASEALNNIAAESENLTVRITSFSFHRGMPKDNSPHGGGFVFDARSLPNPGREESFKPLTGRDAPVAEYLNHQKSVREFFANVVSLVDASVLNYQERGFKNLAVSFGCTGGQHRSVYLAEQLAKHLRGCNGVDVVLRHRELEGSGQ